jgi:hypothetical protein
VNWNLSYPDRSAVKLKPVKIIDEWTNRTVMATPGDYTVTLSRRVDGKFTDLAAPQKFKVIPLKEGALKGSSHDDIKGFIEEHQAFQEDLTATTTILSNQLLKIDAMKRALAKAKNPTYELEKKIYDTRMQLLEIEKELSGDKTKGEIGEKSNPTPKDADYIGIVASRTTYGPTANHKAAIVRAKKQLSGIKTKLDIIIKNVLPDIVQGLKNEGAPWIEGQGLINN